MNKKPPLSAFLTPILISGLILASALHFGTVKAATEVTGIISSDTTWTKTNSPYNLTGPTAIGEGVTLTIEAGVTVNLNHYDIEINGSLIARGNAADKIVFNSGDIKFIHESNDWNDETQSGSILEHAILNCPLDTGNASIKIIHNSFTQGLDVGGSSSIISQNTITSSVGSDWWGRPLYKGTGLYVSGNAYVSDNVIFGSFTAAAVTISGSPTIQRNVISNDYGYGSADYHQAGILIHVSSALVQNNTIEKNAIGISIGDNSSPTVIYNNIQDNTNYNIYSHSQSNINVTYNWWGTTDTQAINQTIYDSKYDFHLGTVSFVPFLTAPNPEATRDPNAPIPTPTISPSPSPTSSPDQTPTPTPKEPQTIQFETILGVVIMVAVIGTGLGLLVYLIKRK